VVEPAEAAVELAVAAVDVAAAGEAAVEVAERRQQFLRLRWLSPVRPQLAERRMRAGEQPPDSRAN